MKVIKIRKILSEMNKVINGINGDLVTLTRISANFMMTFNKRLDRTWAIVNTFQERFESMKRGHEKHFEFTKRGMEQNSIYIGQLFAEILLLKASNKMLKEKVEDLENEGDLVINVLVGIVNEIEISHPNSGLA